jgi:hypothetical protein
MGHRNFLTAESAEAQGENAEGEVAASQIPSYGSQ